MKAYLTHLALILSLTLSTQIDAATPSNAPPTAANVDATSVSSLSTLADRLLPEVVNVSSSSIVGPAKARHASPDEDGPDAAPDDGPQIPQFAPGSPLDEYFRDYLQQNTAPYAPKQEMQAQGSGFIISADGTVVTNEHVIRDADKVTVTLQDGTVLPARIIGRDRRTDLAVLKVDNSAPLPSVKFGDSDTARTGDRVIAIGNPFGLSGTVTSGIISSRSRDIHHGLYNDYIQTDAAINRGNSGGPMFNMSGEVIGINTAIFSTSGGSIGLGFAIPANDARPVIAQLVRDGHVTRGWFGVQLQDISPNVAQQAGIKANQGGTITQLDPKGPALKSGLKKGDAIIAMDNAVIDRGTLARRVAATKPGTRIDLTYWRDGHPNHVKIVTALSPEKPDLPPAGTRISGPQHIAFADLGLTVGALNDVIRKSKGLSDAQRGVMVLSVSPGSIAARRGIKAEEIILQVQKIETDSPAAFAHEIDRARDQNPRTILILIQAKNGMHWVPITIGSELR